MADKEKVERRKSAALRRKEEAERRRLGEEFAWVGTMLERRSQKGDRRHSHGRRSKDK